MSAKITATSFKLGEITKKVWSGDIVTECEFVRPLSNGGLLFWDKTFKCYRRAYWEEMGRGMILNGWDCSSSPFTQ